MELRKMSGNLGISISGGVNTNHPNGGIYIKSLVAGGAAERDGRLHTGDRLVEVDGFNFQGFTYQQAVECLSKTGEVVTFVVEKGSMNLPRVSLSAENSSAVPNQTVSPSTSRQRFNSCSSTSTPVITVSGQPRVYSFATDGRTPHLVTEIHKIHSEISKIKSPRSLFENSLEILPVLSVCEQNG